MTIEVGEDPGNVLSFPKNAKRHRACKISETKSYHQKMATCQHHDCSIDPVQPILTCDQCGALLEPYDWMRKTMKWFGHSIKAGALRQKEDLERESQELSELIRQLRGEFKSEVERRRFEASPVVKPPKRAKLYEVKS